MKNKNLKVDSLFDKVRSWLYDLFHKNKVKQLAPIEEQSNKTKSDDKKSNTFEEYQLKNERREYILNLQKKYKAKEIRQEEMSEEDRTDLENLYIEQNQELKRKIRTLEYKIDKANHKE